VGRYGQTELSYQFGLNPAINYLSHYDGIGWSYYFVASMNDTVDRMTQLDYTQGFWLYANTEHNQTFTLPVGNDDTSLPALHQGWNMVGFGRAIGETSNTNNTTTLEDLMADTPLESGTTVSRIWIQHNGTWYTYPSATNIPTITSIPLGSGVWMKVE
jgi:hypothetical protein